jgi:hypothetical protein
LRKESEPIIAAKKVYAKGSFLIFQEPPVFDDPDSIGRIGLRASESLIFASIPPSRQVLESLLRICHPKQIVLAFEPSGEISLGSFLKHLAGLIQYAVSNREGLASLEDLAQAMNSRNESVEAGIRWLNASGKIEIMSYDRNLYRLNIKKSEMDERTVQATEKTLRFLLKETGAYTQFIQTLSVENVASIVNTISG